MLFWMANCILLLISTIEESRYICSGLSSGEKGICLNP